METKETLPLRAYALAAGLGLILAGLLVPFGGGSQAATGGMGVTGTGTVRTVPKEMVTGQTQPLTDQEFGIGPEAAAKAPPATGGIRFGSRILRRGMKGDDVRVLNGVLRSKDYVGRVKFGVLFNGRTARAVKRFQAQHLIRASGVVNRHTARTLAGSMSRANATWYGPGFYGNQTACGKRLGYGTVGVAHRTLPCGTPVTFHYRGRAIVTRVIDRGPFVRGIDWDLTGAAARRLGFSGSGPIRFAVAR